MVCGFSAECGFSAAPFGECIPLADQASNLQATFRFKCGGVPSVLLRSTVRRSEASFRGCERVFTRLAAPVHGGEFTFECQFDKFRCECQFDKFRCGSKRLGRGA